MWSSNIWFPVHSLLNRKSLNIHSLRIRTISLKRSFWLLRLYTTVTYCISQLLWFPNAVCTVKPSVPAELLCRKSPRVSIAKQKVHWCVFLIPQFYFPVFSTIIRWITRWYYFLKSFDHKYRWRFYYWNFFVTFNRT